METVAQQVVLPGDVLAHVSAATEVRLGAGLTQLRDQVVATRAGRLQQRDDGSKLWVEAPQVRGRLLGGSACSCSSQFFLAHATEALRPL